MGSVRLGKTGITVNKIGFGVLPLQRVDMPTAKQILRHAYENGVEYFDTARAYTDSEEKIGAALHDVRHKIILATKSMAGTAEGFWQDLHASLKTLRTEYIDVMQLHNPAFCPRPGDESGLYDAVQQAQRKGLVRHIGITNHRLAVAQEALESGLYATLQFPFSYLAGEQERALVRRCAELDVGFVAMKGLCGGLLTDGSACYSWMNGWDNVLPIWGIQRMGELEEFLDCGRRQPALTAEQRAMIEADRAALAGNFCRACGYCMPCPKGIDISNGARMSQLLRRMPPEGWLTEEYRQVMLRIEDCTNCRQCAAKCPYGIDTPALLRQNLEDYKTFL